MTRAKEFRRIGVDAIFIEALPDRDSMRRAVEEIGIPTFANIIEGGLTENLSAKDLGELGMAAVAYPWRLVAAKLKAIREALESLKQSMTVGAPSQILSYSEVCEGVGFNRYWDLEERYKYNEQGLITAVSSENGVYASNGVNGH
jgi:2-methylisocitrate lyase-like PEP mutase family enzyme